MIHIETIVVNLLGEPSAGKSTAAMDITARLKRKGVNAEYVTEFAKDKVYENNKEVFKHQQYLFGKQSFRMGRVRNKVQVMVVDSPLLLNIIYNDDDVLGEDFNRTVLNVFNSYRNINYLLVRKHTYENDGRRHNEEQSFGIRKLIKDKLEELNIDYKTATSSEDDCEKIANEIIREVKKNEQ